MSLLLGASATHRARPRRRVLVLAIPALLVGGIFYARSRPVPVRATPVERGRAVSAVYATGTLEPVERRAVRARTAGLLAELRVREGDRVRKGDLLGRVDPGALAAELSRGKAELRAAEAQAGPDAPTVARLRSQADSIAADLRLAEEDQQRIRRLGAANAASKAEVERVESRVAQLAASLAAKQAELRSTQIDLSVSTSRSRASVESALARLAETELRAPIDGVVLTRTIEPGEVVQREQAVLKIGDPSALQVEALVDEADLAEVHDGARASRVVARFYALPEHPIDGTVISVGPEAQRERKAFLVKMRLDEVPPALRVGMSAEINIITAVAEQALVVPTAALDGDRAWVVRDGRARKVPVTRGVGDLLRTELKAGVTEGELVVIDGIQKLSDGRRVVAAVERDLPTRPLPQGR